MKKIAVSILAVLIACPAFAAHESSWTIMGLNPYIGLRGGASYTNLNYNFNQHKESMTDEAFQGRAALGLEVCDTIRSEVEWSIFSKMKDTANFNSIPNVEVETKLQTLLWNNYWEFSKYKIIRPFLGLGAGVAFTDVKRSPAGQDSHSNSKANFSAMGSLGLTFDMEYIAVDLSARYTYVDVRSGLHNFGGDIGIRFMF